MKTQLLTIAIVASMLVSCGQDNSKQNQEQVSPEIVNIDATASDVNVKSKSGKFQFEENNFEFSTINSGTEVVHAFKFKNIGDGDIVISQAKGSCGCTQPEYPQNPVKPGEEGEIKVTFRSKGIAGQVVKDITILANTVPTTKILTISGEVLATAEK
ncbi:MAG: DUF1573 domain-containing protein [Bacteroidetes bacterium]|nr:DUF1573 domain-containing protein [Bacteroidota bacterium]